MTARARNPQTLLAPPVMALYYSRGIAASMLATALIAGAYMAYVLVALSQSFLGWPIATLMALALAPMIGLPLVAGWRALRWEGPVLVLDEDGITDHRRRQSFVPWKDVAELNLNRPAGQLTLSVEFNDRETARKYVSNPLLMNSIVRHLLFLGHRNHSIALLRCRAIEVIDGARALRQHSIRVRVREANLRREVKEAQRRGRSTTAL